MESFERLERWGLSADDIRLHCSYDCKLCLSQRAVRDTRGNKYHVLDPTRLGGSWYKTLLGYSNEYRWSEQLDQALGEYESTETLWAAVRARLVMNGLHRVVVPAAKEVEARLDASLGTKATAASQAELDELDMALTLISATGAACSRYKECYRYVGMGGSTSGT